MTLEPRLLINVDTTQGETAFGVSVDELKKYGHTKEAWDLCRRVFCTNTHNEMIAVIEDYCVINWRVSLGDGRDLP